jgi:hypothetical protein
MYMNLSLNIRLISRGDLMFNIEFSSDLFDISLKRV